MTKVWSQEREEAEQYVQMMQKTVKHDIIPLAQRIARDIGSLNEGREMADIASGPGLLSIQLSKLLPRTSLTCVDISEHMLDISQRLAKESDVELKRLCSDALDIKAGNGSYNIIVSKNTIHELSDPNRFLDELFRLLSPAGKLFLIDFDGEHPSWKVRPLWILIRLASGKESANGFWHSFKSGFKRTDMVEMCKKAGFRDVKAEKNGCNYYLICSK